MKVKFNYQALALPERYRGEAELDIDQCISCGLCVAICPNKALERVEVIKQYRGKYTITYPRIDFKKCCFCGLCQDVCPVGAIRLWKNLYLSAADPAEMVREPLRLEDVE